MNILERIVEEKRQEVLKLKKHGIKSYGDFETKKLSLIDAITDENDVSIIAEVKKASPSKGLICKDFEPVKIATDYEKGGAKAVSVLTDEKFFQGNIDYLVQVKSKIKLPVLRKDFIIDHLQVEESHACGADAILLICAILDDVLLKELFYHSRELGLSCLVEVHDEHEAERALKAEVELIGINNRNLKDFSVSLDTSVKVRSIIPAHIPVVSESGIRDRNDIEMLSKHNIQGVLIGEHLVKSKDRVKKLKQLLGRDI